MIVTDIVEKTKTKSRIFIDEQPAFVLYKGEIRKYNIKAGEELSDELYRTIFNEVLPKRAKLRSMNLLKNRDYTKYQLAMKLKQNDYPQEIIDEAVGYAEAYGYIDDIRYAKTYIEHSGKTKSRKQIENALLQKGMAREDIERAYQLCMEEDSLIDEEMLIENLLIKKKFNKKFKNEYNQQEATLEEKRKMAGFLYRKGFSLEKIYKVIQNIEL